MISGWAAGEADRFWAAVGEPHHFPRDLMGTVPLVLPLTVAVVPALTLGRIERWLAERGSPYCIPCTDRRLHGCLIAYGGCGIVFVDGADSADERRFTLAHEVAHFLLDYLHPRQAVVTTLGEGITAVLDGHRPPSRAERIDAVLACCSIGVHFHLLGRGVSQSSSILVAEDRADRLACELLAPETAVIHHVGCTMSDEEELTLVLRGSFGLPAPKAIAYATRLFQSRCPAPSFVAWLRS